MINTRPENLKLLKEELEILKVQASNLAPYMEVDNKKLIFSVLTDVSTRLNVLSEKYHIEL